MLSPVLQVILANNPTEGEEHGASDFQSEALDTHLHFSWLS